LTFVPLNLGVSGNPLEGLYSADFTPDVLKADASEFVGMEGDIIVTGETTGLVHRVTWNGSQFVVTQVGSFPNQPEDGVFVTPTMVKLAVPEPSGIISTIVGLVALLALRVPSRSWAGFKSVP
jgi:hypothetical protein